MEFVGLFFIKKYNFSYVSDTTYLLVLLTSFVKGNCEFFFNAFFRFDLKNVL